MKRHAKQTAGGFPSAQLVSTTSASPRDLEASVRFYTEVFGMERIPASTFAGESTQARLFLARRERELAR